MLEKLQIIKLNEALVLFKMGMHITRHSVAKVMLGVFNIILVLTVIYAPTWHWTLTNMWNMGTGASIILWILCTCKPSFSIHVFTLLLTCFFRCCRQTMFMWLWHFKMLWQCDFQRGKCITRMLQQRSCVIACTMATLTLPYSNFPPPPMYSLHLQQIPVPYRRGKNLWWCLQITWMTKIIDIGTVMKGRRLTMWDRCLLLLLVGT